MVSLSVTEINPSCTIFELLYVEKYYDLEI